MYQRGEQVEEGGEGSRFHAGTAEKDALLVYTWTTVH